MTILFYYLANLYDLFTEDKHVRVFQALWVEMAHHPSTTPNITYLPVLYYAAA